MGQAKRAVFGAVVLGGVAVAGVLALRLWPARRFVRYPDAVAAQVKNVHAYQGAPLCQACHAGEDRRLTVDPLSTCARCHPFEQHRSHVVGVAQVRPPPEQVPLPLAVGGVIVCHTCHEPHADMRTAHGLRRADDPNQLCLACHQQH